ncbi:MAG: THUMP domain-containing protein [Candidatus Methanomethylicaceae archaeon]
MKEFKLIVTTQRGNETRCAKEVLILAKRLGFEDVEIERTRFPGLLIGRVEDDPVNFTRGARGVIEKDPWEFKYLQRIVPIQRICEADVLSMKAVVKELLHLIPERSSFKVVVNKRGSQLSREGVIREVASLIERRVDLERPDVILQIEIIEDAAGISVISEGDIVSVTKLQEEALEG